MKSSKVSKVAALCAAAGLALSTVVSTNAAAEPVSSSFAVVGSDTLQDVLNALANGTSITGANVRSTAGDQNIGSFDATGSTWIQTKANGPRFGRPNGSGDGVKALSRSIDGAPYTSGTPGAPANVVITGQVDVARSSSGPGSNTNPAGPLLYIPFGRDALTYAHSGGANAAFDSIDAATLKGLFDCSITTVGGVAVTPVIPQAGSGTRSDWLSKLGLTEATLGSCVQVGQEHDTEKLSDGSAFPANAVTPMSAAQWVAQNTGAGIDRRGAGVKVGSPIAGTPAVTGTGTAMVPNAAFYSNSTWGRDTYIVVENARVTAGDTKYDAKLADLVSNAGSKLGNTQSALGFQAGSVKKKFGFLAPSTTAPQRANLR
ncbi:substrate-binding domain-containing protein [Tessaracoccus lubricantis]|uniref:Substrate-binding domain-containing protein n=1 Tax=Tessaracoccus lubricantis TaxID=545543 RepID=A0ABP9FVZ9_9ACTN